MSSFLVIKIFVDTKDKSCRYNFKIVSQKYRIDVISEVGSFLQIINVDRLIFNINKYNFQITIAPIICFKLCTMNNLSLKHKVK